MKVLSEKKSVFFNSFVSVCSLLYHNHDNVLCRLWTHFILVWFFFVQNYVLTWSFWLEWWGKFVLAWSLWSEWKTSFYFGLSLFLIKCCFDLIPLIRMMRQVCLGLNLFWSQWWSELFFRTCERIKKIWSEYRCYC